MNKQREALSIALNDYIQALNSIEVQLIMAEDRAVREQLKIRRDKIREKISKIELIPASLETVEIALPARKPLTIDQIMLLANEASGKYWGTEAHIVAIVRLVEKAHGIGEV